MYIKTKSKTLDMLLDEIDNDEELYLSNQDQQLIINQYNSVNQQKLFLDDNEL